MACFHKPSIRRKLKTSRAARGLPARRSFTASPAACGAAASRKTLGCRTLATLSNCLITKLGLCMTLSWEHNDACFFTQRGSVPRVGSGTGGGMRQHCGCLGALTGTFRTCANRPVRLCDVAGSRSAWAASDVVQVPDAVLARGAWKAQAARGPPACPEPGSQIGTWSRAHVRCGILIPRFSTV
jgi:hypothetical protein